MKAKLRLKTGYMHSTRKAVHRLVKTVESEGIEAFGPIFTRMLDNNALRRFAERNLIPQAASSSRTRKLIGLYQRAWQKRFMVMTKEYMAYRSSGRSTEGGKRWKEWKARHMGKRPYTNESTIAYTDDMMMTGLLKGSVTEAFSSLTSTEYVTFPNLMVQSGWQFHPEHYPRRVSPYQGWRGKDGQGPTISQESYVRIILSEMIQANLISGEQDFISFEESDLLAIRRAMMAIIRHEFIEPLVQNIEDWPLDA